MSYVLLLCAYVFIIFIIYLYIYIFSVAKNNVLFLVYARNCTNGPFFSHVQPRRVDRAYILTCNVSLGAEPCCNNDVTNPASMTSLTTL